MSFLFHSLILCEVLDHSISRTVEFGSTEGVKVGLKEVVASHSQFARRHNFTFRKRKRRFLISLSLSFIDITLGQRLMSISSMVGVNLDCQTDPLFTSMAGLSDLGNEDIPIYLGHRW
jgi:hypothetical protein